MVSPLILRLTIPLVCVSLLLLGVGVVGAWYVHHIQQNVSHTLLMNVSNMRAAEEVEILVREIRTQLDNYLITGDRKYLQAGTTFRQETDRWLAVAEKFSVTPSEKEMTARARRGYRQFLKEIDQPMESIAHVDLNPRVRRLIDEVLVREILQPTHAYLDHNEEEVEKSLAQNEKMADAMSYALLSLGVCGCGAGLAAGFGIARGISRSLIQLSLPIRAAAGQLEAVVGPITIPSGSGLGQLEDLMRAIADRIGAVVERLRLSEREVLRAEQLAEVGQMAAGMAHELRNPLTSMKLLVQAALARDSSRSSSPSGTRIGGGLANRDLRILEEEISRVEGLISSFLQFARPPRLERRNVELRELVEQTVGLVLARAAQRDIRIECKMPDAPLWLAVDPGQVRQVFLNLLLNAMEASPTGGVVQVVVEAEPEGLRLEVGDHGGGLPAALGTRIFAPFVTTKEMGMGLGLSISKRIVEEHGGTIVAENRPEGGALFRVHLRAAPATERGDS